MAQETVSLSLTFNFEWPGTQFCVTWKGLKFWGEGELVPKILNNEFFHREKSNFQADHSTGVNELIECFSHVNKMNKINIMVHFDEPWELSHPMSGLVYREIWETLLWKFFPKVCSNLGSVCL